MLEPTDLTLDTVKQLAELEPFGNGHRAVRFLPSQTAESSGRGKIGSDGRHFKAELEVGRRRCAALWWNQPALADKVQPGTRLSAAFELETDTYTGNGAVQMVLKDLDLSEPTA